MTDWPCNWLILTRSKDTQWGIFLEIHSRHFYLPLDYVFRKWIGTRNLQNHKKKLITLCIWMISSYLQKMKQKDSDTTNRNIQPRYRNRIWHWKMRHAHGKEWKRHNGKNRTAKSKKHQNVWRKEKLQILGNIRRGHYQINRDKRKNNKKVVLQMNKKTSRNAALQQKSY